jgi:hypothetical protein
MAKSLYINVFESKRLAGWAWAVKAVDSGNRFPDVDGSFVRLLISWARHLFVDIHTPVSVSFQVALGQPFFFFCMSISGGCFPDFREPCYCGGGGLHAGQFSVAAGDHMTS